MAAHVDHGKTTLSDALVCSNGIISAKLAGKLRYLDSTEEEQKRGITMHSSAISLYYGLSQEPLGGGAPFENGASRKDDSGTTKSVRDEYLINMIDSPGHIDFSSDVSTAARLCDGALIVVDAVEGVCTQTHAVVYKALKERLRPCLVINKIDRLCLELQLSPSEAFYHLRRLVEHVNALASMLLTSELMKRDVKVESNSRLWAGSRENDGGTTQVQLPVPPSSGKSATVNVVIEPPGAGEVSYTDADADDPLVEEWTFAPENGNVVFASALDGWGFGVGKLTAMWAQRFGVNRSILRKYVFDDYGFNPSTKKIVPLQAAGRSAAQGAGRPQPMFATMILEPIWRLYEAAITQKDPQKTANMARRAVSKT